MGGEGKRMLADEERPEFDMECFRQMIGCLTERFISGNAPAMLDFALKSDESRINPDPTFLAPPP